MAIKTIGIVGVGAVGYMLAQKWSEAGFDILATDTDPEKREQLAATVPKAHLAPHSEAAKADLLVFCVQADNLAAAAAATAPYVGQNTRISGQTSVKTPEVAVFREYFAGNPIVPIHSWHAPKRGTKGQTCFVIDDLASPEHVREVADVCKTLGSVVKAISFEMHDRLSADKQFLTHLAYLSMIRTWAMKGSFPWEGSGIDSAKASVALNTIANEEHVPRNIALLNPFVPPVARQYEKSIDELHHASGIDFNERKASWQGLFAGYRGINIAPILEKYKGEGPHIPNSHLSQLGVADTWSALGISPQDRFMANTPPSLLLEGCVRYICTNSDLLDESVRTLISDSRVRAEDSDFVKYTKEWVDVVVTRNHQGYTRLFKETQSRFTKAQLDEAKNRVSEMNRLVTEAQASQ